MRLPPSQHHTGLLSTRARKPATAGRHWEFQLDLSGGFPGRAALHVHCGFASAETAGFFIALRLTGARGRYTFVPKALFVTTEGNTNV
jgi:hypothetical protein